MTTATTEPNTQTDVQRSALALGTCSDRLVSAAMLMDDGLIVAGVRHFSPDMRATLHRIYGDGYHRRVKEQGFIDIRGKFLDRSAAWKRAETTEQILKQVSTPGTLYSENLY